MDNPCKRQILIRTKSFLERQLQIKILLPLFVSRWKSGCPPPRGGGGTKRSHPPSRPLARFALRALRALRLKPVRLDPPPSRGGGCFAIGGEGLLRYLRYWVPPPPFWGVSLTSKGGAHARPLKARPLLARPLLARPPLARPLFPSEPVRFSPPRLFPALCRAQGPHALV